MNILTFEPEG